MTRYRWVAAIVIAMAGPAVHAQAPELRPSFFMSRGETLEQVIRSVNPRITDEKTVIATAQRVNPHLASQDISKALPVDRIVVLPDFNQPRQEFMWFTCRNLTTLVDTAARARFSALANRLGQLQQEHAQKSGGGAHTAVVHVWVLSMRSDSRKLQTASNVPRGLVTSTQYINQTLNGELRNDLFFVLTQDSLWRAMAEAAK